MKRTAALLAICLMCCAQQKEYNGPRPPKPDVPYLVHAGTLVETEITEAKEEQRKNEVAYTISGESSPARTPLAEPVFLFLSDKIPAESMGLFRFEVKNGSRQLVISQKKRDERPLHLTITSLGNRLYRLEVNEGQGLENGEYSLSPQGSNRAFCFQVY